MTSAKLAAVKRSGELLKNSLESCRICPRKCGADRTKGKTGYCRAPFNPVIYSYAPHHGEEPPLSGTRGSGTIFFTYCNMKCVYCQNYHFSQLDNGDELSIEGLAGAMLHLQKAGCHNINLVSPTHYVPQIVHSLEIALDGGLDIPIVYNSGGYDLADTIRLLDGVIDIYMPDMRYSDDAMARRYSDAPDYVGYNRAAVREMHRQVGDLVLDEDGAARKGMIIRLLSLPEDIAGTIETLKFIRREVSRETYLSIMSQYFPTFKAHHYKELSRGVTGPEYKNVVDASRLLGLNNGWVQEMPSESDSRFRGTNIRPKKEIG